MQQLAAVQATLSMEVLFALLGEFLILPIVLPGRVSWIGITIVIVGMVLPSIQTNKLIHPTRPIRKQITG